MKQMPEGWRKLLDCADKPLRHYGLQYSKEDVDLNEVCYLMSEMAEANLEAAEILDTLGPEFSTLKVFSVIQKFKEWK